MDLTHKLAEQIAKQKLVVIIRGVEKKYLKDLCETLYNAGIKFVEFTFNFFSDEETAECIKFINENFKEKLYVGAGTVLTEKQAELTKQAGGKFIISPNVDEKVIKKTKELNMVSMPAGVTPTEIVNAYNYGADIVKLFPAANFGQDYLMAVSAPLADIPIMAVGGITLENIPPFLKAGAKVFGIGWNIIRKDLILKGEFKKIKDIAEKYVTAVNAEWIIKLNN